jgi:hypothetical protein
MATLPGKLRIALLGAVLAALALPAVSLAAYYVPPGNSAANQYTEAFPTAGGESGGKPGKGKATPAQTLGARNAKRLHAQGPAGTAAAEVAAETAPASVVVAEGGSTPQGGGGTAGGGSATAPGGGAATAPGGQGSPSAGGGEAHSNGGADGGQTGASPSGPAGSSGIGEVVRQATGSSDDGNLGLLLPIVILATIAGSVAYRLRTHSHHGPTA